MYTYNILFYLAFGDKTFTEIPPLDYNSPGTSFLLQSFVSFTSLLLLFYTRFVHNRDWNLLKRMLNT